MQAGNTLPAIFKAEEAKIPVLLLPKPKNTEYRGKYQIQADNQPDFRQSLYRRGKMKIKIRESKDEPTAAKTVVIAIITLLIYFKPIYVILIPLIWAEIMTIEITK